MSASVFQDNVLSMTLLAKEFAMPTSATSGIQDYDEEGARRKPRKRKKSPPKQYEDQQGGSTASPENDDAADGAYDVPDEQPHEPPDEETDSDDELSAKRKKRGDKDWATWDAKQRGSLATSGSNTHTELTTSGGNSHVANTAKGMPRDYEQDPNRNDATDTDPNATGYGKRKFSDKQRAAAADKGEALPDGSYPIKSVQDLKNAVQAYGRAKNRAKVKAHIISRAKALNATDQLPDGWAKKMLITELDDEGLQKFWDRHSAAFEGDAPLVKGVYDCAALGQLILQLKGLADSAAYERQVEGDDSKVPEQLRDEAAKLLDVLSDMASEESQETTDGTTMEDVMRDSQPTMTPGLYRSDVGALAKALRQTLLNIGDDDLSKVGARHNKKDLETIQKCHDALCELGASCKGPHEQDGTAVNPSEETTKMRKADTITTQGNERGASVSDPKPGLNSDNAGPDDDSEDVTADQGQEKAKKGKKRMDMDEMDRDMDSKKAKKGKKRMDMDMDDEDDDDCDPDDPDSDCDDDDDSDKSAKARKTRKAKKSFDAEDLAKVVATAVATAVVQALGKNDGGREMTIPRVAPSLHAVGKDGSVTKFDVESLVKSVKEHPDDAMNKYASRGDNKTTTLIKAIHANPAFRLSHNDIPSN